MADKVCQGCVKVTGANRAMRRLFERSLHKKYTKKGYMRDVKLRKKK